MSTPGPDGSATGIETDEISEEERYSNEARMRTQSSSIGGNGMGASVSQTKRLGAMGNRRIAVYVQVTGIEVGRK